METRREFMALAAAAASPQEAVSALVSGKLLVTDVHDVGPLVSGVPLVVLDCYEHAFYVDYKNRKGDYVSAYPKFVDWAEIDRRIRAAK